MKKAKGYHLNFVLIEQNDFRPWPVVISDKDEMGSSINIELVNFMNGNTVEATQMILDDIDSLNFDFPVKEYVIPGGEDEQVEIFSDPPRAVIYSYEGDIIIPLDDLIGILHEWKSFLESLPAGHSLM